MGYENPMPVQEEVIPYLLGENNDVVALAQTGQEKQPHLVCRLLQQIDVKNRIPQSLILCPYSWALSPDSRRFERLLQIHWRAESTPGIRWFFYWQSDTQPETRCTYHRGHSRTFIGLNGAQDRILVHYSQRGNGRSGRNAEYGIYG